MLNHCWKQKVIRFFREEDGPTAVEYAVMLMLMIMSVISVVQAIGGMVEGSYDSSNDQIESAFND